jgi:hypothetical protein
MDLVGDKNIVKEHFDALWRFAKGRNPKVIITGRPNLFLNEPEMEYALRLAKTKHTLNMFSFPSIPIYIKMLDRAKIEQTLAAWPSEVADGLLASYDREVAGSEFRDLISRPSMLMHAASIWPRLAGHLNEDMSGARLMRWFLYDTFYRKRRAMLNSPFSRSDILKTQLRLSLNELVFFMRAVALAMLHKSGSANRITKSDFIDVVLGLLSHFPAHLAKLRLSEVEDAEFNKLPEYRTEQLLSEYVSASKTHDRQIEFAIAREVASTGILVEGDASGSSFRMAHKSFFEYILAETYVMQTLNKFFESDGEYKCICDAIRIDCKYLEIPFESVIHAANLIKQFGKEAEFSLKTDILSRLVFRKTALFRSVIQLAEATTGISFLVLAILGLIDIFLYIYFPGAVANVMLYVCLLLGGVFLVSGLSSFITSSILERALSLIKWDHNTNRVIIAHNFLFERSFKKLTRQMTYSTICKYLIGNCNVLVLNDEIVKINVNTSETLDDFCRITNDPHFGIVNVLERGSRVRASDSVRRSAGLNPGEPLLVWENAGWKQVTYRFHDFESLRTRVVLEKINFVIRRARKILRKVIKSRVSKK